MRAHCYLTPPFQTNFDLCASHIELPIVFRKQCFLYLSRSGLNTLSPIFPECNCCRQNGTQIYLVPNPGTCEYATLHRKRN